MKSLMERNQSSDNLMSKATIFPMLVIKPLFPMLVIKPGTQHEPSLGKGLCAYPLYYIRSFSDNCRTHCGKKLEDVSRVQDSDEMYMKY